MTPARRRSRFDDAAVLAVTVSLLLHAFVYVAFLNLCGAGVRCGTVPAKQPVRDEIVESVQRVAIVKRASSPGAAARAGTASLAMRGRRRPLRRGQGEYWPLRSWTAHGVRFYFVAYRFMYPDGTLEQGDVPWPVHFAAGEDPFASAPRGLALATALPPPPNDYLPPGTLGRALRSYFPQLSFED